MAQAQTVQNILTNLSAGTEKTRLDTLKNLFWSELNYEHANQPIPTDQWTPRQKAGLQEISIFATSESQFGRFEIIYSRLDKLSRVTEREMITVLLRDHPYVLFVFSDDTWTNWHFVNVKYAKDASARRLLRRITVGPREQLRTASERIAMLDLADLAPDMFGLAPLTIQERHDEAFDVEAVTDAFYRQYEAIFTNAEKQIRGVSGDARRLFTQRLFNRLMFVRFVERKGWLTFEDSPDYLKALWEDYAKEKRAGNNFYASRLTTLFFAGLNNPDERDLMSINRQGGLQALIGNVPYLNGGLFEESEEDSDSVSVPDEAIDPILNGEDSLFYRFNFTVTESTPFDVEVAVDPEMLGKIFEELVTGRHETGSYYTPKAIVSFMGREAIRNYLQVRCPKEKKAAIDAFVNDQNASQLSDPEGILNALKAIKICDPACGSGAYLLGMMQELLELRRNLFIARQLDAIGVFNRKLEIIETNLYGVDIDQFAVNIARLRLWLSLIVDYDGEKPRPLPNLDYKLEVGNSLTASDPSGGIQPNLFRKDQIDKYSDLKDRYLNSHDEEKKALREQIEAQRKVISEWLQGDRKLKNTAGGFDWAVEFTEVFADENGRKGGFDVIMANPPYVRHELIKGQKPVLKIVYGDKYSGTADLYVYFYFRALQLLRNDGVLTFISSNKWMRAGYGEKLRETLRTQTTIESLIDFGDLPVFGATAYPCVIVARKAQTSEKHSVKALTVDDLSVIDQLLYEVDTYGWQQPQTSLDKNGWALMRPELLALLEKLKKSGKPLGEYVDDAIYRGIVTGFNEAFVIDQATRSLLIAEDKISEEIIKPYLRGRDIKRWRIETENLHIIFTRRGININRYPAIKKYLSQFKDKLMPGVPGGRKAGTYEWYEIQDNIAYYAEFEKPKIIYPDIAKIPSFALDTSGYFGGNTMYMFPTNDLLVLGILNSKVFNFYYSYTSSTIRGDYMRFFTSYIERTPIPEINSTLRERINRVVKSLINTQEQNRIVSLLEAELNHLVYQAYGLNEAEIQLIDTSPQTIAQIREEHPDQWLAIEVTERDPETTQPIRGYLRAEGEDQFDAMEKIKEQHIKSLYLFYNDASQEAVNEIEAN